MKKDKLTLQELFTWQDILNFCLEDYSFGYSFLEKAYSKKNQLEYITNYIDSFMEGVIKKDFPDFPFGYTGFNHYFYIKKDDNNQKRLYLSFCSFILDLLSFSANRYLNKDRLLKILDSDNPNLKEDVINELKQYKREVNEDISKCDTKEIVIGYNPEYKIQSSKEQLKETLFAKRKMIIWLIRHYDELYDFTQKPLDLSLLDIINKDKFLLVMTTFALKETGILRNELIDSVQDGLYAINDYLLLVDYLNEENKDKYYVNFSSQMHNGKDLILSNETIRSEFNKYWDKNPGLKDSYQFSSSYEEILQNRAQETWKSIQNKKLAQKIKLNWEMIPAGNKISLSNYQASSKARIISSGGDKQAKLKKDYDLVEEKMEYFSNTRPLFELTGIDTFEGYSAYMYQNGVVVFEKFFKQSGKKDKSMMVPVSGEAIYVMNFQEFADLSKYTKMELIQEIHDFNNQDVKRIYHTPNGSWKDKVDKAITGPGYGMLDLQQIDVLANELVSESKQKVKRIEE